MWLTRGGGARACREISSQLVVLDIGLPDLDGYEVAQLIRGAEWGTSIVLVAATGWGR